MPASRFRLRSGDLDWGPVCPDCAGPKADNARRCRSCWRDNSLRPRHGYWDRRTCSCGGPKSRKAAKCLRCEHRARTGVPRPTPVVVPADHIWRRKRFGRRAA